MNADQLIQVKIKNAKGYDIIKCVYINNDTKEISIVDEIIQEAYIPDKEQFINKIITEQDGELFDLAIKYYHLKRCATVYYATKLRKYIAYIKK